MALAEHLHPKTYWEKRSELHEVTMGAFLNIIAHGMPLDVQRAMEHHMAAWNRALGNLNEQHPAPDNAEMRGGNVPLD